MLNGSPQIGQALATEKLRFEVANFHPFIGASIRYESEGGIRIGAHRLKFDGADWELTIDGLQDYYERTRQADGRLEIGHTGEIQRSDGGTLDPDEIDQVLSALFFFLSFARGIWCAPIFPRGEVAGGTAWERYASWRTSPWKQVSSWFPRNDAEDACALWAGYTKRWNDPNWQYPLQIAIHWYIEANGNAGAIEGSIVLTQTALELLSWAVVVEDEKKFSSINFDRLSAADKIRNLLASLSIPEAIPKELESLQKTAVELSVPAGPEVLVALRNSIIHPKKSKRDMLAQTRHEARWEALQFGLWCIEMCILRLCGYEGVYYNRLKSGYPLDVREKVPWAP